MFYGARVVRGSDWDWANQDGGEGHVGTIIVPEQEHITDTTTVWVHWDSGTSANYNGGKGKGFDLRIYDNAQLGVKHKDVRCDGCMKSHIEGMRWKCAVCHDFDLCSKCYMSDKHDTSHPFFRIDVPKAEPVKLPVREGCRKVKAKGIFPGAKVKRGLKWEWGDQDGGKGNTGNVTDLGDWDENTYRTKVRVEWSNGHRNQYRLGYNGKVDVIYVKGSEGNAGFYYPNHLPAVDFEETPNFITPGDKVKVKQLPKDIFEQLQKERCGWRDDMETAIDLSGEVKAVDKDGDIKVEFENGKSWFINPVCLLPEEKSDQGRTNVVDVDTADDSDEDAAGVLLKLLVLSELAKAGGGTSPRSNSEEIIQAAAKGDVEKVKDLSRRYPNMLNNRSAEKGYTALHVSSHGGHYYVVEALLAAKADKEITDKDGDTALGFSCYGNKPSITKLLLKKGSNVNATNNAGKSSLHTAAGKGLSACASALLNSDDIQINLQDNDGTTPLMRAIESNDSATIDLIADEPKVDFSIRNKKGFNSLHYAAIRGCTHAVEKIVAKCSPELVEDKKTDGWTALHLACFNNKIGAARALVQRGHANMNCRTLKEETPLHLACNEGLNDSIEFLVNGGAEVNAQDEDGDTPLHFMLMKQTVRVLMGQTAVGALLQGIREDSEGADTSARNIAAIAVYLIKNGADIYKRNQKGKTVLDCVHNQALRDLLQKAYNDVRMRQSANITARLLQEECKVS